MTRLPPVDGKTVINALGRAGFAVVRVRGSHHVLRHLDGRVTTVPVHAAEPIGRGLMSKILRDCQLTRDEFQDLLD